MPIARLLAPLLIILAPRAGAQGSCLASILPSAGGLRTGVGSGSGLRLRQAKIGTVEAVHGQPCHGILHLPGGGERRANLVHVAQRRAGRVDFAHGRWSLLCVMLDHHGHRLCSRHLAALRVVPERDQSVGLG
jgi:hypothetical protein